MIEKVLQTTNVQGIDHNTIKKNLLEAIADEIDGLNKVLLVPPDITRLHSGAGMITAMLYEMLKDVCHVDILPALGTHDPMTAEEIETFFGRSIPNDRFIVHNWRTDVVKIGEIPSVYVADVSEGLIDTPITAEVNKRLVDGTYDRVKPPKFVPLISRHFPDWQRIHRGFGCPEKHEGGWHYIHAANPL